MPAERIEIHVQYKTKPCSMPVHDGSGSNQDERFPPPRLESRPLRAENKPVTAETFVNFRGPDGPIGQTRTFSTQPKTACAGPLIECEGVACAKRAVAGGEPSFRGRGPRGSEKN